MTPFQDLLRNLPNRSATGMPGEEDDDDEELEAYEDSIQRLRVCTKPPKPVIIAYSCYSRTGS
jgi:hypothetical protein